MTPGHVKGGAYLLISNDSHRCETWRHAGLPLGAVAVKTSACRATSMPARFTFMHIITRDSGSSGTTTVNHLYSYVGMLKRLLIGMQTSCTYVHPTRWTARTNCIRYLHFLYLIHGGSFVIRCILWAFHRWYENIRSTRIEQKSIQTFLEVLSRYLLSKI